MQKKLRRLRNDLIDLYWYEFLPSFRIMILARRWRLRAGQPHAGAQKTPMVGASWWSKNGWVEAGRAQNVSWRAGL
jgi:hypothetical protein